MSFQVIVTNFSNGRGKCARVIRFSQALLSAPVCNSPNRNPRLACQFPIFRLGCLHADLSARSSQRLLYPDIFLKKMLVAFPEVSVLAEDLRHLLLSLSQHGTLFLPSQAGLLVTAPHQCNPVFHVSPLSIFSLFQQKNQIISLSF